MLNSPKNDATRVLAPNKKAQENHQVKFFQFNRNCKIRVFLISGDPWFVATDVCDALSIKNTSQAIAPLTNFERSMLNIGRQGDAWIVSESGMYFLMLRCRDAIKEGTTPYNFRIWVTSEVIPSIRKTGSYSKTSLHPGRMIPTECIVLTCTDQSGKEKQAYLYYGDDSWFDMSRLDGDRELIMKYMMAHIAERDKEVVKYDRHCYLFRNGKWEPSGLMSRTVDKITVNSDPVGYCKLAIKDYEEAKVKMKKAAKVVADI